MLEVYSQRNISFFYARQDNEEKYIRTNYTAYLKLNDSILNIASNYCYEPDGAFTIIKKEPACKPGSVENSHSSRLQVTLQLKQSTQEPRGPRVCSPI
jgi:hypothetical protein